MLTERLTEPGPRFRTATRRTVRPPGAPASPQSFRHRRARCRWSIHSGQRRRHAHELRPCRRHSGEARDRLWRSGSQHLAFTPPRLRKVRFLMYAVSYLRENADAKRQKEGNAWTCHERGVRRGARESAGGETETSCSEAAACASLVRAQVLDGDGLNYNY